MALENGHSSFLQFFIAQFLEGFNEKTYEKTCRFYNTYSKSSSICTRLRSFTIWIFFSKISWLFQLNVQFFLFAPLLRQNLWKNLAILWLISKGSIILCRFTKFRHLNFFKKKWCLFQNVNNLLFISSTLSNICGKTYENTYYLFQYILELRLCLYGFTKFHDDQIHKTNMAPAWICQQNLAYSINFEQ